MNHDAFETWTIALPPAPTANHSHHVHSRALTKRTRDWIDTAHKLMLMVGLPRDRYLDYEKTYFVRLHIWLTTEKADATGSTQLIENTVTRWLAIPDEYTGEVHVYKRFVRRAEQGSVVRISIAPVQDKRAFNQMHSCEWPDVPVGRMSA